MTCKTCGHTKSQHIYEEGACRPGFVCACDKFLPPTPPDTALACLDEGERELVADLVACDADPQDSIVALIRRLACELDDAKDGAEVLHEEIAKYRTQLSQRDSEIAELKGRIGEAVTALRTETDMSVSGTPGGRYNGNYIAQSTARSIADRLEGKGETE